jgi:hypothetical protein
MAVNGQVNAEAHLPLVKQPQYPFDRRLGVPHIMSGVLSTPTINLELISCSYPSIFIFNFFPLC